MFSFTNASRDLVDRTEPYTNRFLFQLPLTYESAQRLHRNAHEYVFEFLRSIHPDLTWRKYKRDWSDSYACEPVWIAEDLAVRIEGPEGVFLLWVWSTEDWS
jgi:hypothetical protein